MRLSLHTLPVDGGEQEHCLSGFIKNPDHFDVEVM
jgi:hypothetical protein